MSSISLVAQRPVSRSKKPKNKLGRVDPDKALTPTEVGRLKRWALQIVGQARTDAHVDPYTVRNAVIALVLLGTGARRFELCAFDCGAFYRGHGGPVAAFTEAKGNKVAEVPITEEIMQVVEWWFSWKRARGESTEKDAPLFCGRPGEFMSRATLHNAWKATLDAASVPTKYGVHASRHAAGLLLLQATGSLSKVCEFLRHSSERVTERFYRHVLASDVRQGLERAGL